MHRLKGSPCIIVLLFYFTCLWTEVVGICPVRCECNDESLIVLCDSANLDVVPITLNPELKQLHLGNNHIKSIMGSFNVYRNLKYLDMSHNQLVSLDKANFMILQHLQILLLNRNMVSALHNDTFQGLHALEVLHVNENFLEEISGSVFAHLLNLEKLDLSQNRIATIEDDGFAGLTKLKILLLRDNKLSSIPSEAFHNVPNLLKLDFGLNRFVEIPENAFSSLNELEELSLDGCGVKTIHYGAFKWLNSLLVLRLHDNELRDIPTKPLFDVIRLEELHIGQNKFRELKPLAFQRLKYLSVIEINGAPLLERIDRSSFADNSNLKQVVMNHNKNLRHIQQGAFESLPNIQHVSLRGNGFQTFHYSLLPWDELDYLDVRDNPLECNCTLLWLAKLLQTKNFSSVTSPSADLTQVTCVSPIGLKDRVLSELTADDLNCYSVDARRQIIIGIVVAAAVAAAAIVMLGFRYRDKVAGVLKNKWNGSRKEPQYQKTSGGEEESTILQAAQQSMKLTPVTEL